MGKTVTQRVQELGEEYFSSTGRQPTQLLMNQEDFKAYKHENAIPEDRQFHHLSAHIKGKKVDLLETTGELELI